ncbi:MAG: hypothetical protein ABSE83_11385 [Methanobacterium sp.]
MVSVCVSPVIVRSVLMFMLDSWYVPGSSIIVSPFCAAFTAAVIVV